MKVIHTDGRNPDFIRLCNQLDSTLDKMVGKAVQRDQYDLYNRLDDIHDAVLIYLEDRPVACGSFKRYNNSTAEIKRIFVREEYRGRGLSRILMEELEKKAAAEGYEKLILETGRMLIASMSLYKSVGFKVIRNYGPYENMSESVCMRKRLCLESL